MGEGRIVSIHSYRGGTGKSNMSANVAAACVKHGRRVAVLDTDLQSPGVHVIFGFEHQDIRLTLLDFLWDKCSITETAYDVSSRVDTSAGGRLWLVPASMDAQAISKILDEGYDASRLNTHFDELIDTLDLDLLVIDTHPGLNNETMLTSAISDVLIMLLRPDRQDYQGTAVINQISKKLEIPEIFIVANKVFSGLDRAQLKETIEKTYGHEVIGMIPLSEDLARTESRELFINRHPNHEITHTINAIAERVLGI